MRDRQPLLLLLQGGLGNQLLQFVLAASLANAQGRPLMTSSVLMNSWSRRLRGLTPRAVSPLIREQVPMASVPWHRYSVPRLLHRLADCRGSGVLSDRRLAEVKTSSPIAEELWWVDVIHSHATHPCMFGDEFNSNWMTLLDAVGAYSCITSADIVVHVRRTDYLNPGSGFLALGEPYYRSAIFRALSRLPHGVKSTVIQICTDDPAWCLKHLRDPAWRLTISDGGPEQDLALMINANVLVTSNSSLSAVAAHLAQLRNPSVSVFTPMRWLLRDDGRLGELKKANWEVIDVESPFAT